MLPAIYGLFFFRSMKFILFASLCVIIALNLETAESRDIAEDARELADFEEDAFDGAEMELEMADEVPKNSPWGGRRRRRWRRLVRHARNAVTAWKICTAAGVCG